MLERLIADGLAGRFPAEEVDIRDWKEMLKRAQDLQLKLGKRLNQRAAHGRGAQAPMEALREKREALTRAAFARAMLQRWPRSRGSSSRWRSSLSARSRAAAGLAGAKSATLAALERVEKARKKLDEASRELLTKPVAAGEEQLPPGRQVVGAHHGFAARVRV